MNPARRPARRIAFVVALALVALLASSCAGGLVGESPAATVGGVDISQDDVTDAASAREELLVAQIAAAQAQLDGGTAPGADQASLDASAERALAPYQGPNDDTVPTEGAALALTELIQLELYRAAMDGAGLELGDGEVAAARSSLESQAQSQNLPLDSLPESFLDQISELTAMESALGAAAPDELQQAVVDAGVAYEEQLEELYDANPESFEQICGRALVASSQDEAQAGLDRVNGGESFDEVVAELSGVEVEQAAQPQCIPGANYSQIFAPDGSAPTIGETVGPSNAEGAWVVFVVDSIEQPAFEDVRAGLAEQVPDEGTPAAQAAITAYVSDLVGEAADVTVDPRYGTWDPETLSVVPPSVASAEPEGTGVVPAN